MKVTAKVEREIEVAAIRCVVAVRYDEDDMPNDYPHRHGDTWDVMIDVASGQIKDWPANVEPRDLYMKITDQGTYYLLNHGGAIVGTIKQDYVPSCIPSKWGDYIDFKIDGSGRIINWKFDEDAAAKEFFPDEDE